MQATDNAIPTVAKTPGHIDPNASCPLTPPPVGVFPYDVPGPFFSGDTIENRAVAKSAAGLYYEIWAGAPGDHPNQGLIRVFNDDPDMCASMAKGKLISQMRDYIAPNGPITLTEIVGDVIGYRLPGGKTGRFNFVTGAYMP